MSEIKNIKADSTGMNGRLVNPYRPLSDNWRAFESAVKTYPFTKPVEPGKVVRCELKYYEEPQDEDHLEWREISEKRYKYIKAWNDDKLYNGLHPVCMMYQPIEQPKEEKKDMENADEEQPTHVSIAEYNKIKAQLNNQAKHKESLKQYWMSCAESKKKWVEAIQEYFDSEHPEAIQSFDDFKEQFDLD